MKAPLKLRVIVVGCGVGGLAAAVCLGKAGHEVVVVDGATELREVGAGIQISPNVTRLFVRWGLEERLEELAVKPQIWNFCRYDTGERFGLSLLGDKMLRDHGARYYHVHRVDLLNMLLEVAKPLMTLRLGSKVVSIDASTPSVTLQSQEVLSADVVIGADGIKSICRDNVVGRPDHPIPSGDAVYRCIIPTAELMKDPELRPFVETPQVHCWLGPEKHVIGYCIRACKEYNLVLQYLDDGSVESWTREGSVEKMRREFAGWEPRLQKLMALAKKTLNSKIMYRPPLERWLHPHGRVVLLGDACHPMLPYRAQGAAMAIEDAAVLGRLLALISSREQIPSVLHAYQELRYPRATKTQTASRLNRDIFCMHDGEAQQARDASMRVAMEVALKELRGESDDNPLPGNANAWADKAKNQEQFSYDADAVVDQWWRDNKDTIYTTSRM
ncbi:putative FAD binding domain containing protein [Lyophyllum shimeji]|uniref:FAD binding domain containing protein n=1 Tax=Lyophyllum shimeji TaxID=47721 RepID=A0A9P3PPV5_LYOSH|nr:putative FAD binding domain containing protein [Lyophyllum shimeji]